MMAVADSKEPKYVEDVVDTPRTRKYLRTLRSVAWMLHWHKSIKNTQTMPTLGELQCTRKVILKQVHRKFFREELKALKKGQPVQRQSSLMSLHPFLEGGLIGMGGRLQQVEATFDELHPVLVKKCGVSDQIVLHINEQCNTPVLQQLFQNCNAKGFGSCAQRSRSICHTEVQKMFLAAPASEKTSPFPRCRVTCERFFETTGMDLGEPLYLKDNSKVWFVVFTCM